MVVYITSSELVLDCESDSSSQLSTTKEQAQQILRDEKERIVKTLPDGWEILNDDDDCFSSCEEGYYAQNHFNVEVYQAVLQTDGDSLEAMQGKFRELVLEKAQAELTAVIQKYGKDNQLMTGVLSDESFYIFQQANEMFSQDVIYVECPTYGDLNVVEVCEVSGMALQDDSVSLITDKGRLGLSVFSASSIVEFVREVKACLDK